MQVYTEPRSDPLVDYLLLVLALDRLEALGLSQGPLSDRLREAMDMPWKVLSREEKGWLEDMLDGLDEERKGTPKTTEPA